MTSILQKFLKSCVPSKCLLAYIILFYDHLDDAVDVQVLAVEVVLISPPDAIIAGIELILDFSLVHKFDLCFCFYIHKIHLLVAAY